MEGIIYKTIRKQISISNREIQEIGSSVFTYLKKRDKSISIHLIGDCKMKTLNTNFRGKESTTDVLSFAIQEGEHFFDSEDVGDIFISIQQIKKQAKEFHISFKEEFVRMLVHGILHVNGYDHETKKEAKEMFHLQEEIIKNLINII